MSLSPLKPGIEIQDSRFHTRVRARIRSVAPPRAGEADLELCNADVNSIIWLTAIREKKIERSFELADLVVACEFATYNNPNDNSNINTRERRGRAKKFQFSSRDKQ